jgi:hypothetical protein
MLSALRHRRANDTILDFAGFNLCPRNGSANGVRSQG